MKLIEESSTCFFCAISGSFRCLSYLNNINTSLNLDGIKADVSNYYRRLAVRIVDAQFRKIVHGSESGFKYTYRLPAEWHVDSTYSAKVGDDYHIYRSKSDFKSGGLLMQIRKYNKGRGGTEGALKGSVDQYVLDVGETLIIKDWPLALDYSHSSVYLSQPGRFHQYILYLDPGPKYPNGLSIALNFGAEPPETNYLSLLEELIREIEIL